MPHTAAQIIILDDFPPVVSGTPALQTMQAHGKMTVYISRPETQAVVLFLLQCQRPSTFTTRLYRSCRRMSRLALLHL